MNRPSHESSETPLSDVKLAVNLDCTDPRRRQQLRSGQQRGRREFGMGPRPVKRRRRNRRGHTA